LTWPTPEDATFDIKLRVKLIRNGKESTISTSNLRYMYWCPVQQLTHHAASGCGMRTGDLIGTGTVSGAGVDEKGEKAELGCLFEAIQTKTQVLPALQGKSGYEEGYLEDGDEIILEGWCEDKNGKAVLGLGECRGRIVPPK
jgi:fumarylacetoacetase